MKRVLVTGAAGFTGRYVAEILSDHGHEIHGLVHRHGAGHVPGIDRLYEVDLNDPAAIRNIVSDVQPDYVVHLAAIAFVAHSDVDEMYRVNVLGTRNLLDALKRLSKKPDSILLASSANIYGNSYEGMLVETTPAAPANDYGVTKVAMEYVASIFRPALPIIIARPFNYTGRGQSPDFVIPKIVDHARMRAPVIELGNLDIARDFSDVRTVADAYARLIQTPAAIGETLNVCSGRAVSLHEVIDFVSNLSGHSFDVRTNAAFVRPNEVRSLHGSSARIESVIGQLRSVPLEETLHWMLNA